MGHFLLESELDQRLINRHGVQTASSFAPTRELTAMQVMLQRSPRDQAEVPLL